MPTATPSISQRPAWDTLTALLDQSCFPRGARSDYGLALHDFERARERGDLRAALLSVACVRARLRLWAEDRRLRDGGGEIVQWDYRYVGSPDDPRTWGARSRQQESREAFAAEGNRRRGPRPSDDEQLEGLAGAGPDEDGNYRGVYYEGRQTGLAKLGAPKKPWQDQGRVTRAILTECPSYSLAQLRTGRPDSTTRDALALAVFRVWDAFRPTRRYRVPEMAAVLAKHRDTVNELRRRGARLAGEDAGKEPGLVQRTMSRAERRKSDHDLERERARRWDHEGLPLYPKPKGPTVGAAVSSAKKFAAAIGSEWEHRFGSRALSGRCYAMTKQAQDYECETTIEEVASGIFRPGRG